MTSYFFVVTGVQMSPEDHCETMDLPCVEQMDYRTQNVERDTLSQAFRNQSNASSRHSRRRDSEQHQLSFSRRPREHMENPQSQRRFTVSPTSQESTTGSRMAGRSTRTKRSKSRRHRNRRARQRDERSLRPDNTSELETSYVSLSPEASDQVSVGENESFSRNMPYEIPRQQITRPVLQSNDDFAATGQSSDVQSESYPHVTSSRESVRSQRRHILIVPNLEITFTPREDSSHNDMESINELIPERLYNSASIEHVPEDGRNTFSSAEEVGIRRNVDTLRIPTFRNSNIVISDTNSVETPKRVLGQIPTGFDGSNNLISTNRDLQYIYFVPAQNLQREEPQNRRDGSNLNPTFESNFDATATYNSILYAAHSHGNLVVSATSHNEHPEIVSNLFESINETSALLDSQSQSRQGSLPAHLEISNESSGWLMLPEPSLEDESIFNPSIQLTKQKIDTLPRRTFGRREPVKKCTICISEYEEGDNIRTLPCFHEYHVQCIDPWLLDNSTCPICRLNVLE